LRAKLVSRVQRLEARVRRARQSTLRIGRLKQLPLDYIGERHVVVVEKRPDTPAGFCEFEERPGRARCRDEEAYPRVYLSEDDLNL
jgi:hypothetical protein